MHRNLSLVHHEAGLLIRLTLPLLFAQLSQTAMGFVDTVMAGRYASIDLAAVAVGSSLFFPVFLFLLGLQSAVTPLVAQANGRGDAAAVRAFVAAEAPWLRVVPADEAVWKSLGAPPKVPTVLVFDRAGALVRAFDRRAAPIPALADLEAALAAISPG